MSKSTYCCLEHVFFFFNIFISLRTVNGNWLCSQGWSKGVVFINGKNLGRYWSTGPQQTLYVPGPWLHRGDNQVLRLLQKHTCLPFRKSV